MNQTSVIRKRPELMTLPTIPKILKISDVPTGTCLLRINLPFTMTHLAHAGVQRAWVNISTGKTVMTLLGNETAFLKQVKQTLTNQIVEKYPILAKHIGIQMMVQIRYGSHYEVGGGDVKNERPMGLHYVANVPAIVEAFEDCGYSKVPMMIFQMPIEKPAMILTFTRHVQYDGFIVSQFGNYGYDHYKESELRKLLADNPVLEKMNCHICNTSLVTGVLETCLVKGRNTQ